MTTIKDKASDAVKSAAETVKNAVTGNKNETEDAIENDVLDSNPPGSASVIGRGVPNRAVNENRSSVSTNKPISKVSDSIEAPEIREVVATIPYKEIDPIKEARKALANQLSVNEVEKRDEIRKAGKKDDKKVMSPETVAALIRIMGSAPISVKNDLSAIIEALDLHPDTLREIQEMAKHPELFAGDQKPGNLQVLSLPPGAQKPVEYDETPGLAGTTIDRRYYPTRYAMPPKDDDFEAGDIIYSVHEDATFTVLSVAQQTPEWQASHATPPMNVIRRIGGELADLPDEVTDSGLAKKK